MSNQDQTPSASIVRKIEELDHLINFVRATARTCLARSGDHAGIFEELKILLEEIASRVSDHCPDTNLDSPVVEKVSSVAALALRTVETDSLNNAIQDCLRSINVWQPFHTSSKSFEKPLPIFGTPAEQDEMVERIEEEKRELAVSEGRIDENERRSAIRDNTKLLLRLDDVRRSILSCTVDNTTDVENGDTYSITRVPSAGRNEFCYIVRFGNERCVIQNEERGQVQFLVPPIR